MPRFRCFPRRCASLRTSPATPRPLSVTWRRGLAFRRGGPARLRAWRSAPRLRRSCRPSARRRRRRGLRCSRRCPSRLSARPPRSAPHARPPVTSVTALSAPAAVRPARTSPCNIRHGSQRARRGPPRHRAAPVLPPPTPLLCMPVLSLAPLPQPYMLGWACPLHQIPCHVSGDRPSPAYIGRDSVHGTGPAPCQLHPMPAGHGPCSRTTI
jgi:hypothetical protein